MALVEEVTLPKPRGQEMLGPLRCFSPRPRAWAFLFHLLWTEGHQADRALKGGLVLRWFWLNRMSKKECCLPTSFPPDPVLVSKLLAAPQSCGTWHWLSPLPGTLFSRFSTWLFKTSPADCSEPTQHEGCFLQEAFPHLHSRTHHPS